MTANTVRALLAKYDRTALWLAEMSGYKPTSVYNALSQDKFTEKLEKAIDRAFAEESRRQTVDLSRPSASIWDLVYFSGIEMATIDRAKRAGGYDELPKFYRDSIIAFADGILAKEGASSIRPQNALDTSAHWIDLRGGVAAGSQISGDAPCETIPVAKTYPEDCYALRVFGHSMEPEILDRSIIIVQRLPSGTHPKKKSIVVYSDAMGSSLKEFGYRKAKGDEEPDAFGNVPVLRSLNKNCPEIQTMDGGKIEAVFVESL